MPNAITNALTIDVEEHFQVHNLETVVPRSEWDRMPSRVVDNTRRILQLLAARKTKATFFVLGWVAERHPELVRDIVADGHELGTHGYAHELIYRQTPAEFEKDVAKSLDAINGAFRGHPTPQIQGYRAPAFSITKDSRWALDVLTGLGLRYDSSIFPLAAHDRYGISDAKRFAARFASGLWEFPLSTLRIAGRNLPVGGGGYFRLYPSWITKAAIRLINNEGHPAVMYLHPWEFDPDQPRASNVPALARFRHYVNLDSTLPKLDGLLGSDLRFGPIRDAFSQELSN